MMGDISVTAKKPNKKQGGGVSFNTYKLFFYFFFASVRRPMVVEGGSVG